MKNFLIGTLQLIVAPLIVIYLGWIFIYKPWEESKSKPKVEAQLTFSGPREPKHLEDTTSKEKLMLYPFDVKIINSGNVPITIIRVIPQYWVSSLNPIYVDAIYDNKMPLFDDSDIPAGQSRIVPIRAFINDDVIVNNEVNIQAKVVIQGDQSAEKEAIINVYSLLRDGKEFYKGKTKIINFK